MECVFPWSFGPNSAWGSIKTATIMKTDPTLPEWIINKVRKNRHEIGLDLSKFYKQFIEAIFVQLFVDNVNQWDHMTAKNMIWGRWELNQGPTSENRTQRSARKIPTSLPDWDIMFGNQWERHGTQEFSRFMPTQDVQVDFQTLFPHQERSRRYVTVRNFVTKIGVRIPDGHFVRIPHEST